ncbi:MAG: hypothetical protein ACR2HC_05655 [Thermoleophilaceae bacterium]
MVQTRALELPAGALGPLLRPELGERDDRRRDGLPRHGLVPPPLDEAERE